MIASLRSLRSIFAQNFDVMEALSESVLMRTERTLDLLQGMLVLVGWYQYFCLMHAQLNNVVQLAVSVLADLGLTRSHSFQEYSRTMLSPADDAGGQDEPGTPSCSRHLVHEFPVRTVQPDQQLPGDIADV